MKLPDWKINEGRLSLDGCPAKFEADVWKAIPVGDIGLAVQIAGFKKDDSHTPHANIFLLDFEGNVIWQIQEFTEVKGRCGLILESIFTK